jgi:hypothetical protein
MQYLDAWLPRIGKATGATCSGHQSPDEENDDFMRLPPESQVNVLLAVAKNIGDCPRLENIRNNNRPAA